MLQPLDRRKFLGMAAAASAGHFAAPVFGAVAAPTHTACGLASPEPVEYIPNAAVSLRSLSFDLEETAFRHLTNRAARAKWKRATTLYGLKELYGFISDTVNGDVILLGRADGPSVGLNVVDLVVAIRSVLGFYPVLADGKKIYYSAGVSIDGIHELYAKMKESGKQASEAYCKTRNYSRVYGMPFNCRTSKLLLDADAKMKQTLFGVHPQKIREPFPTITELRETRLRNDGVVAVRGEHQGTRFWFAPDIFSYREDETARVRIFDRKTIALNSVGSMPDPNGGTRDTAQLDPDARTATCAWTARMNEFHRAEPIWQEMYHIFSHFGVVNMMQDAGALSIVTKSSRWLIEEFTVPYVRTPLTYPSLAKISMSLGCGGVSLSFDDQVLAKSEEQLPSAVSTRVLRSRPSLATSAWRV